MAKELESILEQRVGEMQAAYREEKRVQGVANNDTRRALNGAKRLLDSLLHVLEEKGW